MRYIESCEPHDPEKDGDVPKNQAVIELDVETWEVSLLPSESCEQMLKRLLRRNDIEADPG